MLVLNNITFEFGSRALYDQASWHIKPNEKIGLIGANGTGKSTLLRIINGEYQLAGGEITGRKDVSIAFLNQDLLSYQSEDNILKVAMEAFEVQNRLHDEIQIILDKLEYDHSEGTLNKLHDLQHEFEVLDGYNIQYKAEQVLEGLGFTTAQLQKPLNTFSGGWRMRVMLAKILLQQPDLLLLDEPTNHLDLPSIEWLENYLTTYTGTFIIVSHDRFFLDKVVTKIAEVAQSKITLYTGNYSFYLEEKAERQEMQRAQFKNQQKFIKEQERLIDRFKAKASKASMAQSRMKMLAKLERFDDVEESDGAIKVNFNFDKQPGKIIAQVNVKSKAYADVEVLTNTSLTINRGDKIALIGANGRGKSTLLRIINNSEPFEGKHEWGHQVVPSFFAQHQLESLNLKLNPLEELQHCAPEQTDNNLRGLLGAFLFEGDDVFKKIAVLSGGEKSRVALAKTILTKANFLLLDEPTNHLDMKSVNVLIRVLNRYEGSFVCVSHDRFFLSQIANKIWYIENKELKEYPGNYEEYQIWLEEKAAQANNKTNVAKAEAKQEAIVKETEVKKSEDKERKKQHQ
ncbi:MAG TPA: ATP-binding cassette domain-containing protein, partial [Bacteroidia bacterium]|nr:ATP-binding cassette domain-containing protein [Bacteroidia bacterium]